MMRGIALGVCYWLWGGHESAGTGGARRSGTGARAQRRPGVRGGAGARLLKQVSHFVFECGAYISETDAVSVCARAVSRDSVSCRSCSSRLSSIFLIAKGLGQPLGAW